jgi:phosphoglycerate dehydrogenase-like enzyme
MEYGAGNAQLPLGKTRAAITTTAAFDPSISRRILEVLRIMKIIVSINRAETAIDALRNAFPSDEMVLAPYIGNAKQTLPAELIADADIIFCELPPENFDDFKRLRWIQVCSSGYAQLVPLPLVQRNIIATNGTGNYDIPIAEWTIMMTLVWHRNLLDVLENQRHKRFDRDAHFQHELRGSIMGIIGYGGIGRQTARLAKGMGLRVHVLTRTGTTPPRELKFCEAGTGDPEGKLPDRVSALGDIDAFLSELDYLVLAIPHIPMNENLINEARLRHLKPSAVLINPARGALIDNTALLRALNEGWIRGASLDTHVEYPIPASYPFWNAPNVIVTPHISGHSATDRFVERAFRIFSENLSRFQNGNPLLNRLSSRQLAGE